MITMAMANVKEYEDEMWLTFHIAGCGVRGDDIRAQVSQTIDDARRAVRVAWPLPRPLQAHPSTHVRRQT